MLSQEEHWEVIMEGGDGVIRQYLFVKVTSDWKPEQIEGILSRTGQGTLLGERTAQAKVLRWEYGWGVGDQSDR